MAKRSVDIAQIIGNQLSAAAPISPAGPRSIEDITGEILRLKEDAGNAIIGIGQRLIEAKDKLSHGEWLPWLTEQVEFSERTAQNFMRLAREWSNPHAVADLGARKALMMLALPPDERDLFMSENHIVDGEEKNVFNMSSRELADAIRERDDARKEAEEARAEAEVAEAGRAKLAEDMAILKQIQDAAAAELAERDRALEQVRAELQALQDKPVDVAVMAVDEEALSKARAEAVAELQAKLDKAVEARKKAEEKRKAAEEALEKGKAEAVASLQKQLEQAETELQTTQRQLEAAVKAEKQAALNGDQDLAAFNVIFGEAQEQVNKLHGLLLKVQGRDDGALAAKLKRALLALADNIRGCAE